MSNEWSKEWPSVTDQPIIENKQPWPEAWVDASLYGKGFTKDGKHIPLADMFIGVDIATNPDTITAIIGHVKDGVLVITGHHIGDEARAVIETYNNQVPTHDPYTNPDMHIYHECACGAILDPNTKSFATLNNAASYVGWKIRWGHDTYKAYCVECGKDVE